MKIPRLALALIVPGFAALAADAPPLQGAAAVLQSWQAPAKTAESAPAAAQLRPALAAFAANSSTLPPADAAAAWIALVERFQKTDPAARTNERLPTGEPLSFRDVLAVLPPVSAWPALGAALQQTPLAANDPSVSAFALRALGVRLANDGVAEAALREPFAAAVAKSPPYSPAQQLLPLLGPADAPAEQVAAFVRQLELRESGGNPQLNQQLAVPDLVTLAGADAARPLLRRALVSSVLTLQIPRGRETKALARELTLAAVAELKVARWELVNDLGTLDLFEALLKKFGSPAKAADSAKTQPGFDQGYYGPRGNPAYDQARAYQLLNLILAGRAADATALALAMDRPDDNGTLYSAFAALDRLGRETEVAEFFRELLTAHPELPFWDRYVAGAARAGRSDEALALLQSSLASEKLPAARRAQISRFLAGALLAADRVDEGVAELRRSLATPAEKDGSARGVSSAFERLALATQLAWLGSLLDRPALIDEAVAVARTIVTADPSTTAGIAPAFSHLLVAVSRYADAERLLQETMQKILANHRGNPAPAPSYLQTPILTALAEVYHAAGRPADVLLLLDSAPGWGAKDLASIRDSFGYGSGHDAPPNLLLLAATALAKTGQPDRARLVLDELLAREGGSDPAYALLVELAGPAAAAAQLELLARRDPFEERPLVWQAELLRRAGRLDDAEKLARAAIAIDPSDGEQPRGDRMRVYAVLAEILAARGDAASAEFYRKVVRAIRQSEDADRLHEAGLLKRAVALYTRSLGDFADAYCIQSRLAVQLNDLGRFDEAEEHYRKAYELMPDSFGRVESHCFGCERAFGPARAQGVAERVFTRLAEKNPQKPQLAYLLGFLRLEQGRPGEALAHFQRAAQLDPDYLSAWKKISELDNEITLAPADRDAAALQLLRLDPLRRHSTVSFAATRDLRPVFLQIETLRRTTPAASEIVYPLAAAKRELERLETASGRGGYYPGGSGATQHRELTARDLARENRFLVNVAAILDATR